MKSLHYTTGILLCVFFLTACSKSSDEVTPDTGSLEVNLDKTKILSLVNAARTQATVCGSKTKDPVAAIEWSDELAKAALDHSNDMQAQNYFSHTGKDGSSFSQRIRATGYAGSPVGENIALGYRDEEAVIQGWLESTGHCNNIMNGNANQIGIARSAEGNYWTMVLGRKKE